VCGWGHATVQHNASNERARSRLKQSSSLSLSLSYSSRDLQSRVLTYLHTHVKQSRGSRALLTRSEMRNKRMAREREREIEQ
jgi:hypothetical protein